MKMQIGKTVYEVAQEMDMTKYPNVSKYSKRTLIVKGPRGASYMLTESQNGMWSLMAAGFCQPRTTWYKPEAVVEVR